MVFGTYFNIDILVIFIGTLENTQHALVRFLYEALSYMLNYVSQ